MDDDVSRIRRFALIVGLLLLAYDLTGLTLDSKSFKLFNVPLKVDRTDFLPVVLVLFSLYGTVRFHYYAMMLGTSPYRRRRDTLDSLEGGRNIGTYFGATHFRTSINFPDYKEVERQADLVRRTFPKFARGRVTAHRVPVESVDDQGEEKLYWHVECFIPIRCRLGAFLEDVDYTFPLWLNLFALGWFGMNWYLSP